MASAETGPTSTWLWTELKRLGLPAICIDARHAKAVLKMQINKSDRNDAVGIARIMQTGWFKEVHVKDIDSHSVRALLASRALLVKIKRDLENHVRGLLKNLGLVIGRAKFNVFAVRAEELIEGRPELIAAIRPLLEARNAVGQQVSELDRKVMKLARHDAHVRRFMTVPGIGPITALAFKAVATYASAQHLLDRLPSDSVLGCILLDVRIPGLSGLELQQRLSELGSTLPIIFLTGYPDVRTTVRAIKAGAEDFLTKPVSSDKLLEAVERAIARHKATYRRKSTLDVVRSRIATLTPRERQVFELIVRGNMNKQIGRALGTTERTIKAHRHRVMEKMQVQTLAELVSLAERVSLLENASSSGQTAQTILNRFRVVSPCS